MLGKRNHIAAIAFILCLTSFTRAFAHRSAPPDSLSELKEFGTNPGNLSLFYHAPRIKSAENCPLVVVLHGCSETANSVARLTDWNELADRYGFYVLYPQQHFPNNPSHCFNWYKNNEIERGKGECESIRQMAVQMMKNFPIDTSRVFITGLSAGAAMSVVMIATQPGMFKAAAIFAGGPYKPGKNIIGSSAGMLGWVDKTSEEWKELVWEQNPAFKGTYPKVIVYHGNKDPVVNIRNAYELVEQWTALHNTDTVADEVIPNYFGTNDITRLAYLDKNGKEAVVFYKVNDMGHALPVDPGFCDNQGGRKAVFARDKNFFSTYYTACEFGLVPGWDISGPKEVSAGEKNVRFSLPAKEDFTYEWQVPAGCEIIGNKSGNGISVNWGTQGGKINVIETGANTCRYFHHPVTVKLKP
ncbi:MAG: extracellular catalytic domain type 1 short-chain-length polyhydroxyalkanoate depolymerase [Bacteroidia bacterium]